MIVWRKSSHSGSHDESTCVEVARLPLGGSWAIGMRDSKDPDGPWLHLSAAEWFVLLTTIRPHQAGQTRRYP